MYIKHSWIFQNLHYLLIQACIVRSLALQKQRVFKIKQSRHVRNYLGCIKLFVRFIENSLLIITLYKFQVRFMSDILNHFVDAAAGNNVPH